jgi:hypothetical protein
LDQIPFLKVENIRIGVAGTKGRIEIAVAVFERVVVDSLALIVVSRSLQAILMAWEADGFRAGAPD